MATHSRILAWRIPWTEEPGGTEGCKELDITEVTHAQHTCTHVKLQVDWSASEAGREISLSTGTMH